MADMEDQHGVESVPVQVVVSKEEAEGSGKKGQSFGSNGSGDGIVAMDVEKAEKVWKRRDSEGLIKDMEKFAQAPRALGGWTYALAGKDNSFAAKLVRCDREYYGEEEWGKDDVIYLSFASFVVLVWTSINVWQDKDSFLYNNTVNYSFWIKLNAVVFFDVLISWIVGYYVVTREWNIGYGRKLLHFCLFASPVLVNSFLGELDTQIMGLSWLSLVCQIYFVLTLKPVRRRLPMPFMLVFRAIDRPKDRPYTLPWLWAQSILGFIALIMLQVYLSHKNLSQAFFAIPMIVNGLGDGLAEPVGIRFGRHKFQTRALWYKGRMCSGEVIRSFEGSACVFFSAVMAVFAVYIEWCNTTRFVIALAIVPITMTAAEAFSPHTCDTPFIFLVSAALIFFLFECVDDNFDPFSPSYSDS